MNIVKLIKKRHSVRRYIDKAIPEDVIKAIVGAGVWGPSVPTHLGIQPWKFIVVTDKRIISQLSNIMLEKSNESNTVVKFLLKAASQTMANAQTIIIVYNSGEWALLKNKYKEFYFCLKSLIPKAELSAISAAIQNMILTTESFGIGSCWLDTPVLCAEEINRLVNEDRELIAILTLGYPAEKSRRAPRKPMSETVRYI